MDKVAETIDVERDSASKMEQIDFKMVTFSLAGKDYGIDIMTVSEIGKASKFTYVPNSKPFVRGVYNLRGDIISVIDLRIMFNLPAPKRDEGIPENILILRLEEYLIGVIVDSIDKVVGVSSARIQPPHPIFGDINVKYIAGVVDYGENLYVILNTEKILGGKSESEEKQIFRKEEEIKEIESIVSDDLDLKFISETLAAYNGFFTSDINKEWVTKRLEEWKKERSKNKEEIQLQSMEDADEFLRPFYSPGTFAFWKKDDIDALISVLPKPDGNTITVWNPGCSKGHETYSFTCGLRLQYPEASIKVWANDSDLLSISTAPNLVFYDTDIPEYMKPFVRETKDGLTFISAIKDLIFFEYHDVLHQNPFPPVDIVLCRDMVSFHSLSKQAFLIKEFWEKLKEKGLLIMGRNESIPSGGLFEKEGSFSGVYKRK